MARHRACGAALLICLGLTGCTVVDSVKQTLADVETTTSVKYRLATDERISTLTGVHVTTREDWVYLTGTVDSQAEKERIEELVADVAGSNRVVSQLRIAGSPAPTGAPATKK